MEEDVDLFKKNVKTFAKDDEDLVKQILNFQDDTTYFCKTGPNQELNLSIQDVSGNFHTIHSDRDIKKEMQEWVLSFPLQSVKILVIYGVGLGYFFEEVKEWLLKNEDAYLLFFEDDLRVICQLFKTKLGTELINNQKVQLYYVPSFQRVSQILCSISHTIAQKGCFFSDLPLYKKTKSFRSNFIQLQLSEIETNFYSSRELLNFGRAFYANAYRNLLYLPSSFLASRLFGKFKGVAAIVCGAGPSLDLNFDVLQELEGRALLFSGSTGLDALAKGCLQPHFAVGIDPNVYQVSRLAMSNAFDTPFFFHPRLNFDALKLVYGPKLYFQSEEMYKTVNWITDQIGLESQKIRSGHNVVNFEISLAAALGCNPIILVGVDQSYSDKKSYASTVFSHPLSERKKTLITKSKIDELLEVNDINGNRVYTLWKWIFESNWISQFAKENRDIRFINATEGGIGFKGIPNLSLAEVKEKFLLNTYDLRGWVHSEIQQAKILQPLTAEGILDVYKTLCKSLISCGEFCKKLHEKYQKILVNCDVDGVLKEADQLVEKLKEEPAYLNILELFEKMYFTVHEPILNHFSLQKEGGDFDERRAKLYRDLYRFLANGIQENLRAFQLAEYLYQKDRAFFEQELPAKSVRVATDSKKGTSRFFDSKGNLLSDTPLKDGVVDGAVTYYDISGNIYSQQNFIEGKKEGKQHYFYSNGQVKMELFFHLGYLHGCSKFFYPMGSLQREIHFDQGLRHGKERFWNEGDTLIQEFEYRKNQPIGTALEWHYNGVLAKEIKYGDEGEIISLRQWNKNAEPIIENTKVGMDYFEQVAFDTANLTRSLEEIFLAFHQLAMNRLDDNDSQIEEIGKEIESLKAMTEELESLICDSNEREAIWKTPKSQMLLHEYLQKASDKIFSEMEIIKQLIQEFYRRIKNEKQL